MDFLKSFQLSKSRNGMRYNLMKKISRISHSSKDIFHKNDFKDAGVMKTVVAIRTYDKRLGFSEKWITDFVYQVVMLAKKEPRPNTDDDAGKK